MKASSRTVRSALRVAAVAAAVAVTVAYGNHYILEPDDTPIGAPGAVLADAHGNVYFSSQNVVFRLGSDRALTRVAGNGIPGFSGDGGPAVDALLNIPEPYPEQEMQPEDFPPLVGGLSLDRLGNLYVADVYNNRIRRIDRDGIITTVAGGGAPGYYGWSDARVAWPQGVAVDDLGRLHVSSAWGQVNRWDDAGTPTTLAGNNCGAPGQSGVCVPWQIAVDAAGSVFVPHAYCRVDKIAPDGEIVTVLGNPQPTRHLAFTCGHTPDGVRATKTAIGQAYGVAVDRTGSLYVADTVNHCIRKVDVEGTVSTVAGVCTSGGFAGDGGPATEALLHEPRGVSVDATGNVFVADTRNRRIRKVTTDGIIATVAGNGDIARR